MHITTVQLYHMDVWDPLKDLFRQDALVLEHVIHSHRTRSVIPFIKSHLSHLINCVTRECSVDRSRVHT